MDYLTQIHYQNKKGERTIICFISSYVNFMVGDRYIHKTHKTDFNKKIDSDVPDGEYVVIKREWIYHQASIDRITLMVIIEDVPKKVANIKVIGSDEDE